MQTVTVEITDDFSVEVGSRISQAPGGECASLILIKSSRLEELMEWIKAARAREAGQFIATIDDASPKRPDQIMVTFSRQKMNPDRMIEQIRILLKAALALEAEAKAKIKARAKKVVKTMANAVSSVDETPAKEVAAAGSIKDVVPKFVHRRPHSRH